MGRFPTIGSYSEENSIKVVDEALSRCIELESSWSLKYWRLQSECRRLEKEARDWQAECGRRDEVWRHECERRDKFFWGAFRPWVVIVKKTLLRLLMRR